MGRNDILKLLLACLLVGGGLSQFASPWPDGLEKVAAEKGFLEKEAGPSALAAPLAGYLWPGIRCEKASTALAGLFGVVLVFGLGWGLGKLLKKREPQGPAKG